jgi:hypothetical protein
VLRYRPTTSFILLGGNDRARGVRPRQYEAELREIIERLQDAGSKVVMISRPIGGPKQQTAAAGPMPMPERYEAVKRKLARRYGCVFADARRHTKMAWELGLWLWEPDQVHLNLEGYRVVARSVLDALGHEDVPPVEQFKVELMPGLVTPWRLTARPPSPLRAGAGAEAKALDARTVGALRADRSWKVLELPEDRPAEGQANWWLDQVRRQGFALSLASLVGKAETYWGIAEVHSAKAARKYLNTGGALKSVWLNGRKVFAFQKWTGFHPGKERIAVRLRRGVNRIVIETGEQFALNLTDQLLW